MSRIRHARGLLALSAGSLTCFLLLTRGPDPTPVLRALYPRAAWIARDELAAALGGPAPPLVVDVRSAAEMAVSTLPGAVPYEEALSCERPIVVYCSVGWRSARVAEDLGARACEARNLEGGIFAWAGEGRPLVRGATEVRAVHPFDRLWAYWLDDDLEAWSPE